MTPSKPPANGGGCPPRASPFRPLVFVVDDKVKVADCIADELARQGYATQVFRNPLAAATAFTAAKVKPVLLISDFSMPEMDGLELMRRCRQLSSNLPVIIVSGTVSAKVLQGSGLGANVVLDKPLVLSRLMAAVDILVGRHGSETAVEPGQWVERWLDLRRTRSSRPAASLVYVVDDEFIVAEMITLHLARGGYCTRAFERPTTALSAFTSAAPKPALLIADIGMPEMNGFELMRQCRQQCPTLKVILMSGSVDEGTLELPGPKPDAVLSKPFTPSLLLESVGSMIARAPQSVDI